jgi:hypothetical protein
MKIPIAGRQLSLKNICGAKKRNKNTGLSEKESPFCYCGKKGIFFMPVV